MGMVSAFGRPPRIHKRTNDSVCLYGRDMSRPSRIPSVWLVLVTIFCEPQ